MAKPAVRETVEPAEPPEPPDHTSDMVLAQHRASAQHRAQAAKMASFRQHGAVAGRG